jgi:hypothetical protein
VEWKKPKFTEDQQKRTKRVNMKLVETGVSGIYASVVESKNNMSVKKIREEEQEKEITDTEVLCSLSFIE